MKELEKLKRRLFSQEPSEQEQIFGLCEVMEICGGYEQLINLPLPALKFIFRYLEYINKQLKKDMPKMPSLKGFHK